MAFVPERREGACSPTSELCTKAGCQSDPFGDHRRSETGFLVKKKRYRGKLKFTALDRRKRKGKKLLSPFARVQGLVNWQSWAKRSSTQHSMGMCFGRFARQGSLFDAVSRDCDFGAISAKARRSRIAMPQLLVDTRPRSVRLGFLSAYL